MKTFKGIYPKIDWCTVCFNNISIFQVMDMFHLSGWLTEECQNLVANRYLLSAGYDSRMILSMNGLTIKVSYLEISTKCPSFSFIYSPDPQVVLNSGVDPMELFDTPFSSVWLELTGSGLEWVRSQNIDVDTIIFTPFPLLDPTCDYHFTRVDFAFDLVNYASNFVDDVISLLNSSGNKTTGRVALGTEYKSGPGSNLKFDIKDIGQKTFYLGGTRSERLLRGYDKLLQFQQNKSVQCPYIDDDGNPPESWLRLELQVRRQESMNLLYNASADSVTGKFFQIFKFIYERFAIRELTGGRYSPVSHVWTSLFDWEAIPSLLQKSTFVQYRDILQQSKDYVSGACFGSICVLISHYGWDWFKKFIDDQFKRLQMSFDDLPSVRRANAILNKILLSNDNLVPDHLYSKNGVYYFK